MEASADCAWIPAYSGNDSGSEVPVGKMLIVAFIGAGLDIGYLAGVWGKNMALGGEISVPLMVVLGAVGALGRVLQTSLPETVSGQQYLLMRP